jgi:hypothetical protein
MLVRDFLVFTAFYIILKALLLFINLEARRNHIHIPAAVSGLLS